MRAQAWLPSTTTIDYVKGKPFAPKGEAWDKAVEYWRTLVSDEGAVFDKEYHFKAEDIEPQVTWGTSPEMVLDISGKVLILPKKPIRSKRSGMERALEYMGFGSRYAIKRNPCRYRLLSALAPIAVSKTCAKPLLSPKAAKKRTMYNAY